MALSLGRALALVVAAGKRRGKVEVSEEEMPRGLRKKKRKKGKEEER